jgi:ubiquinone/menaquinone biosynthesis C-methylase UbiE
MLLSSPACFATDLPGAYRWGKPDRDGIGKYYMDRQISHVMGHLGAPWLEREGREREERTDLIIANLSLEDNSVVADIGAGTGYFSFPVARRVPGGRVLAVDIQEEMLNIIEKRKKQAGIDNIETVLGSATDPNLPAEKVDLAFIVDAYHEFSHPFEMSQAIFSALKPGGRLVLIEYRGEDASVPIKPLHKMTQQQVRKEMQALGFRWEGTRDFLPQQHFMTFTKPKDKSVPPGSARP